MPKNKGVTGTLSLQFLHFQLHLSQFDETIIITECSPLRHANLLYQGITQQPILQSFVFVLQRLWQVTFISCTPNLSLRYNCRYVLM